MKDKLIETIREVPIVGKTYEEYVEAIAERLAYKAEVRLGEWKDENSRPNSSQFICSVCGRLAYYVQPHRANNWRRCCPYKFCPNCGANMEGERK